MYDVVSAIYGQFFNRSMITVKAGSILFITDQIYRTNMVADQVFGSSFSYTAGTKNSNGKMFK